MLREHRTCSFLSIFCECCAQKVKSSNCSRLPRQSSGRGERAHACVGSVPETPRQLRSDQQFSQVLSPFSVHKLFQISFHGGGSCENKPLERIFICLFECVQARSWVWVDLHGRPFSIPPHSSGEMTFRKFNTSDRVILKFLHPLDKKSQHSAKYCQWYSPKVEKAH